MSESQTTENKPSRLDKLRETRSNWIDLTAAGMRLLLAYHEKTPQPRAVIEGGDKMPEVMNKIGFEPLGNGYYILNAKTIPTQTLLKEIPGARAIQNQRLGDHLLDLTAFDVSGDASNAEVAKTFANAAGELIGYNKGGHPIFQDADGRRYFEITTSKIYEDAAAASVPSYYLRAGDENLLAGCAEGFLRTIRHQPGEPISDVDHFVRIIGIPRSQRGDFVSAVSAAIGREVLKDPAPGRGEKPLLSDRYHNAGELVALARAHGADIATNPQSTILVRRLIGLDKDLRGESVACVGEPSGMFEKLLPQSGVRIGVSPAEAGLCAIFASSPSEAERLLSDRPAQSKTVCAVPVEGIAAARAFAEGVAENSLIEAAAYLDEGAGGPALVMSLVAVEPQDAEWDLAELDSPASAWTWAATVANDRSHAIEKLKSGLATDEDFQAAGAFVADNAYQARYASASRIGEPTSLVPKELAAAMRVALDRIVSNYGSVDEKVARECGYDPSELGKYFAPEQVDGIALMINAEERGRGAVCGDGTGAGKGRQIMAMVRRAVLRGQRCLVFSESAANLSDLMRDAKHIGSLDLVKPLVVNDEKLIDEDTKKEFATLDRSILDAAIERNEWPEGVQVVMTTYSQFNRSPEDSEKAKWLRSIVDDSVTLVGDEIHNAASLSSNVSENYSFIKENAGAVISASATHAKEARNLAFYKEIFPSDIDIPELLAMMVKGGEPFQEVVSDMLAADGVFFRRETDLSEIDFEQLVDTDGLDENREIADKLSVIASEITALSEEIAPLAEARAERVRTTAIGSALYHVTRLLNAALLAPFLADRAVEALKAGEKPAFMLENTVGQLLEEARMADGSEPTFRHVLRRVLDQIVASGDKDGPDRMIALMPPETRAAYDGVVALIDDFPPIPASIIDTIKRRVRAAGYTVGEITGRSLEVNDDGVVVPRRERNKAVIKNAFNSGELDVVVMNATGATGMDLHAGRRFKDRRRRVLYEVQGPKDVLKQIQGYGRFSRRDQETAPRIVFGASGLPFEARLAAMRNRKLRRLSANVQSNRNNTYLVGNIPDLLNPVGDAVITRYAEVRPDLLRRLCLVDRYESRTKLVDVADGSTGFKLDPEKSTELMTEEDAARERREETSAARNGERGDETRTANEFLSRLALLPCREQERILRELTAEYEMQIAELDSLGANPLRPREFEGIVTVGKTKLFEGSLDTGANSAFEAPMYLMEANVERHVDPMPSSVLIDELDRATAVYEEVVTRIDTVVRNRERYLASYLQDGHISVADAMAKGDKRIVSMVTDIEQLKQAIDAFVPGRQISFIDADGIARPAIIAGIELPWEGSEHLINSYRMKIAIPGMEKLKEYGVETILRNNGVGSIDRASGKLEIRTEDGLHGNKYDDIIGMFDNAGRKRHERATFLVGNVFRAVRYATQFRLGSLVSFVDAAGRRHRGVHINRQAEKRLSQIAVRIEGIDQAKKALSRGIEINSSPTGSGRNLIITPVSDGHYDVTLPEPYVRRGVRQWPSEEYRSLYENMVSSRIDPEIAEREQMSKAAIRKAERPRATVPAAELDALLAVVVDAGFRTFYVHPKHRKEVEHEEAEEMRWNPQEARA